MDSILSVSSKGSPVHFGDDSGFGSMQRTRCGSVVLQHTGNLKSFSYNPNKSFNFTCAAHSGYNGRAKRPLISSVETIKKRLFESPFSSDKRSWQESPENTSSPSPIKKTKQVVTQVTEDLKGFTLHTKTINNELPPKCPPSPNVKFFYSPLKNSKLFKIPLPPLQKAAAGTKEAPCAKSWGVSIDLPKQCCDVLKKLAQRNMIAGLSMILSHLSDEDVFRASCVSRAWKQIVVRDSEARRKRESFMQKRFTSKENEKDSLIKDVFRGNVNDGERELFLDVTNRDFSKPSLPSKALVSKSDCFVQVAKCIPKTEVLLKCPMCQYPAKCLKGNKFGCTRDLCNYTFCRECLGSHANSQSCLVFQAIPNITVGSKRSKRNLRRL